jgi:hypothetical protein
LGVVVLGWASDQREVFDLEGAHETTAALLADRADGSHIVEEPALGVVVLGRAGDHRKIGRGVLMG